jgi:hypothetical protein
MYGMRYSGIMSACCRRLCLSCLTRYAANIDNFPLRGDQHVLLGVFCNDEARQELAMSTFVQVLVVIFSSLKLHYRARNLYSIARYIVGLEYIVFPFHEFVFSCLIVIPEVVIDKCWIGLGTCSDVDLCKTLTRSARHHAAHNMSDTVSA